MFQLFLVAKTFHASTYSPHVRESTKVLDSGSQPLDSGFQPFGFRIPTFWIPDSKPLWISGFRIPTAKICWIPDSGFSYMGRTYSFRHLTVSVLSCCGLAIAVNDQKKTLAGFAADLIPYMLEAAYSVRYDCETEPEKVVV